MVVRIIGSEQSENPHPRPTYLPGVTKHIGRQINICSKYLEHARCVDSWDTEPIPTALSFSAMSPPAWNKVITYAEWSGIRNCPMQPARSSSEHPGESYRKQRVAPFYRQHPISMDKTIIINWYQKYSFFIQQFFLPEIQLCGALAARLLRRARKNRRYGSNALSLPPSTAFSGNRVFSDVYFVFVQNARPSCLSCIILFMISLTVGTVS